jgi:hypothetical protein
MPKIKVGISFPKELVHKIDKDRKNVSYGRCILKILRRSYNDAKIDSLDVGFVGLVSSESTR